MDSRVEQRSHIPVHQQVLHHIEVLVQDVTGVCLLLVVYQLQPIMQIFDGQAAIGMTWVSVHVLTVASVVEVIGCFYPLLFGRRHHTLVSCHWKPLSYRRWLRC